MILINCLSTERRVKQILRMSLKYFIPKAPSESCGGVSCRMYYLFCIRPRPLFCYPEESYICQIPPSRLLCMCQQRCAVGISERATKQTHKWRRQKIFLLRWLEGKVSYESLCVCFTLGVLLFWFRFLYDLWFFFLF